jgi:hypothetical protein
MAAHRGTRLYTALLATLLSRLFSHRRTLLTPLKAFLRRGGARTHEARHLAIAQGLETVTPQDALGWFTHCGYQSAQASEL